MRPQDEKKQIPFSLRSGFFTECGENVYLVDHDLQLDLNTFKWKSPEDLIILESKSKDEINMNVK